MSALAGPSLAQWQFSETREEVRAFVQNADGTMLGWRCTSNPIDRQRALLDLTVIPSTTDPDDEEVARFTIGTWDFSSEVVPVGSPRNQRQTYQARLDFLHPVAQRMRDQMSSGNVVRFERTFDFAAISFSLRGSRAAISRLENACPRLWDGRAQAAVTFDNQTWQVTTSDGITRAATRGQDDMSFGLECQTRSRNQVFWVMELPTGNPGLAGTTLNIRIDGVARPFLPQAFASMQDRAGFMPWVIPFDPEAQADILKDLLDGADIIAVPGVATARSGSFSAEGMRRGIQTVLARCGFSMGQLERRLEMSGQAEVTGQDIPDAAIAQLRDVIGQAVAAQCAPGASVAIGEAVLRIEGARVTVRPGSATCTWRSGVNPFCGAARCTVWTYDYDGARFNLTGNDLR